MIHGISYYYGRCKEVVGGLESVLIKKKMVMFVIKANNKTCFGEQLKY